MCWWSLTPILTINIPPKTKVKHHHMCHIMFIIHLVPHVLEEIICMQENSQKWKKGVHGRQVDVAGAMGPHCNIDRHQVASPNGLTPLPRQWSMGEPCWQFLASLLGFVFSNNGTRNALTIFLNAYKNILQAHGYIVVAFHLEVFGYCLFIFSQRKAWCKGL